MKAQNFFFLCGETAVKQYHKMPYGYIVSAEETTPDQRTNLVDYGHLARIDAGGEITMEEVIDLVIEVHEGSLNVARISEHDYKELIKMGL